MSLKTRALSVTLSAAALVLPGIGQTVTVTLGADDVDIDRQTATIADRLGRGRHLWLWGRPDAASGAAERRGLAGETGNSRGSCPDEGPTATSNFTDARSVLFP